MHKRLQMLIADDESSVSRTLAMIFEEEGYEVTTSASCAEAMKALDSSKFDVVVTDLHMEKADIGLEVVQAAQRQVPRPVIVILSGYASMSNTREAMRLRVDYYAFKPVVLDDLLEAVRRLVGWRADAQQAGE